MDTQLFYAYMTYRIVQRVYDYLSHIQYSYIKFRYSSKRPVKDIEPVVSHVVAFSGISHKTSW